MTELHPCPSCKRHVRETECLFCGTRTPRREPIDLGVGSVSRALVFASATLAATAGCAHGRNGSPEGRHEDRHPTRDCIEPDPQKIDELEATKAEVEKRPDSPDKDRKLRDIDEDLRAARAPQCAPYGAPPARRRVV